jgi:hypothetical protein
MEISPAYVCMRVYVHEGLGNVFIFFILGVGKRDGGCTIASVREWRDIETIANRALVGGCGAPKSDICAAIVERDIKCEGRATPDIWIGRGTVALMRGSWERSIRGQWARRVMRRRVVGGHDSAVVVGVDALATELEW